MERRDVLIVGSTQQGKSRFIRILYCGQGLPEEEAPRVGHGTLSCTTEVRRYRLHCEMGATRYQKTNLWDAGDPSAIATRIAGSLAGNFDLADTPSPGIAEDSCRLWHKFKMDQAYKAEAKLVEEVVDVEGRRIQFSAFDVPGSQATDGQDDSYMMNILDAVTGGKADVCCIMLVTKFKEPLTPSLVEQIRRYWEQFEPLRDQWIVLHTHSNPVSTDYDTCFEAQCFQTKSAFNNLLREVLGDRVDKFQHFFIENHIPPQKFGFEPGAEALKHYQVSVQNMLYECLARFQAVPLESLPYVKSAGMKTVDKVMLAALSSAIESHEQVIDQRRREVMEIRDDSTLLRGRLQSLDSRDEVPVSSFLVHEPGRLCGRTSREERISACKEYPELTVRVAKQNWWTATARRRFVRDADTGSHVCVLTAPVWRSLNHVVEVFTLSMYKNGPVIKELKGQLQALSDRETKLSEELAQVQSKQQHCEKLKHLIEHQMTLADYRLLREFYENAVSRNWNAAECCAELAKSADISP